MGWRASAGFAVALITWGGWSTPAASAPGVMIDTPKVEGQAPEHLVSALQTSVRDGLSDAGVEVVEAPEGCQDSTCLAGEVATGNARAYVSAAVTVTGSDYALSVDVLDGAGSSLGRQESTCEICSFDEAAAAMRELTAKAAAELGPPPVVVGTVRIVSDPPGASVSIDGAAVGTTPYEGSLDEGPHSVELSLDGHEPATQQVDVVAGQMSSVDLALARRSRLTPRTTEIIGWSAIGVGAAALAGGITMLVLDENPVKNNCSGVHVDADGDCAFRYNTLGGGIGLTIVGVAAAGAGAALVVLSRKKRQAGKPSDVALGPGRLRVKF